MPWSTPSLDTMRILVRRDIRDSVEAPFTFDDNQVMDYINEGIIELNRTKPIEISHVIYDYPEGIELGIDQNLVDVWAVQIRHTGAYEAHYLPPMSGENPSEGWVYYGKSLRFGQKTIQFIGQHMPSPDWEIAYWAYRNRAIFRGDPGTELCDFLDPEDEFAVRKFARWAGLRSLDSDRALFQQWQQQANNSDVSATQLTQMVTTAEQEWDHFRRKIMLVRRSPIGNR